MDPRAAWALLLLGPALAPAPRPAGPAPGERLCGRRFLRELVRACGGPRWSPAAGEPKAGDRELLRWLEAGHLLLGPAAADGDHALLPAPQPWPGAPRRRRRRRRGAPRNPAQRCCLSGCTPQDLKILCPH